MNQNVHARTSGDEERLDDYHYYTAKTPRLFMNILPAFLRSELQCAMNGNAGKDELRRVNRNAFVERKGKARPNC